MKNRLASVLCQALIGATLVFGAGFSVRVAAQDKPIPAVKATDAPGLLAVLEQGGYDAKIVPRDDEEGNTSIEITTSSGDVYVQFSDCENAVPDFCETLVLSTSWDRVTPMSDSAIAEANRTFKYVSIWRDEEGDPVMQWAILTRDAGVAPPLFLNALQRYLAVVRDFDEIAFEGDEPEETPADALPST